MKADDAQKQARFEASVLVHLDAAYNFARWLLRDANAAEDAVQDACVRALRFFDDMQGLRPKAWFMAIVRNACLDWLRQSRARSQEEPFDESVHGSADRPGSASLSTPENAAVQHAQIRWLWACIQALPEEYREVIVLRELEELSYKEIGAIVDVPIGTVMSRLSRARAMLQQRMLADAARSHS